MRKQFFALLLGACTAASALAEGSKPFPHIGWRSADSSAGLDIGGALRANYRYEDWKGSNYRDPPHLRFDTFRIDSSGFYNNYFFDAGFWFQDHHKYAVDRAYVWGIDLIRIIAYSLAFPASLLAWSPIHNLAGHTAFPLFRFWRQCG